MLKINDLLFQVSPLHKRWHLTKLFPFEQTHLRVYFLDNGLLSWFRGTFWQLWRQIKNGAFSVAIIANALLETGETFGNPRVV